MIFGGFEIRFKNIFMVLSVLVILLLLLGSVSAGWFDFLGEDSSSVANNETNLVVGFVSEFPPFAYKDDNGNYTGFDLDLAQEVCDRNNWALVKHPIVDWESKDAELNSGAIDCIWSEFTINGREDRYTWSDPYFNNSQVFVVKKDSNISSVEDLTGKSVDVKRGSSVIDYLDRNNQTLKNNFGSLNEIQEYNSAFMDLEMGACDAILGDIGEMKYQMAKFNNGRYELLNDTLSSEILGVGFKKGNTELRDQVQETLDEMYEDGTIDRIAQKYKDYGIPERVIHS